MGIPDVGKDHQSDGNALQHGVGVLWCSCRSYVDTQQGFGRLAGDLDLVQRAWLIARHCAWAFAADYYYHVAVSDVIEVFCALAKTFCGAHRGNQGRCFPEGISPTFVSDCDGLSLNPPAAEHFQEACHRKAGRK